jgi:alpha-glucosidase
MLLLTLRGTPTLYYGDEIGMPQSTLGPDEIRDPFERRVPGLGVGRDGCRTPMQWSEEKYAGFSSAPPWLPVEPDYRDRNVASENEVATSLLQLYRRLIALRRKYRALRAGSYRAVIAAGELLLFVRECEDERLLVALNLGDEPTSVSFPVGGLRGHVLLSSFCDRDFEPADASIELRPDEGVIIELHAGAVLPD